MKDRSHRAITQKATLTPPQEAVVLSLRETLCLPLDDLVHITKQYVNSALSHSVVARLLKGHDRSKLADVIPKAEGRTVPPKKTFKRYVPDFIHIDIKYSP